MKVEGLDDKLSHFNPAVAPAEAEKLPTFRQMFVNVLGGSQAANGDQAILMYLVGGKLAKSAEPDVDLDESEVALLTEKCRQNSLGWLAHYQAQVLLKLKAAEGGK